MKYWAVVCLLLLTACQYDIKETMPRLLSERKRLLDSASNINDIIGRYVQKGIYDSAELQKKQLGAVHIRLAEIQSSIDKMQK